MKLLSSLRRLRSTAGFSVVEAIVAMGVGTLAVAGGMALNQQQLRMVKSIRETSGASLSLEERVEQLRLANWRQITDATYLQTKYFPVKPKSSGPLSNLSEQITISAFPDPEACSILKLEKSPSGSVRIIQNGAGLSDQRLARINVSATWTGKDSRRRTRELATVISNAGISRMSLPAMGAGSAGTASGTATPAPASPTPPSTTTDTPTPAPATPTPTPTGNGNGNGNGHGNVGGKSGKG